MIRRFKKAIKELNEKIADIKKTVEKEEKKEAKEIYLLPLSKKAKLKTQTNA